MTVKPTKIGFIGLGQMGRPMVRNLARGNDTLALFDVREEARTATATEVGGRSAVSAQDAAQDADVVILMLPNGPIVQEVVLGTSQGTGLVDVMAPGGLIVDMSSSEPAGTRALGKAVAECGFRLLDAPVSGGVKKAVTGDLAIMVGGDDSAIEEARPLLERMGGKIFIAGPLGAGHAMKALNNYVSAAGLVAAADAVRIGKSFGLKPGTVIDILNASTGRNNSTENKFHQYILSGSFASGFSLALMAKDVGIARSMALASHRRAPLLESCAALWADAAQGDDASLDHTAIFRFLEDLDTRD